MIKKLKYILKLQEKHTQLHEVLQFSFKSFQNLKSLHYNFIINATIAKLKRAKLLAIPKRTQNIWHWFLGK